MLKRMTLDVTDQTAIAMRNSNTKEELSLIYTEVHDQYDMPDSISAMLGLLYASLMGVSLQELAERAERAEQEFGIHPQVSTTLN